MRIYLASTYVGMKPKDREKFISQGHPRYILETFYHGEKTCLKALRDVGTDNFLLDSGAFSFMSGAKTSPERLFEYAKRYAEFIKQNNIKYYFELDVDTIYGIDFVEKIRHTLEEKTQRQSIPVWHKGRGVEYWEQMVKNYKYIAIGGLVFHVKKKELPYIKKLVKYARSKNVKVHGLGFTKTKELLEWDFYSVDSSSWGTSAALGQQMHIFNGERIVSERIDGKGKKINISKLMKHNGIEWCKYQRYMDRKRW